MGVSGATGGALMQNPSIAVQLSVGSSSSRSDSSETQIIHRGSSVNAGGAAAFAATEGNLSIAGSNISASDVLLAAKNQVNVVNTTDTASTRSSNSSKSASVGVSFGTNVFGISAAMANAHGDANSDALIQNASHVTGANSVAIVSGGDTNVIGSQIAGRQIAADVGGNLNIASVQDTTVSAAHQSSTGGGFSISQGGGGASFSAQNGRADGNYAQVKEQAGLVAGDGGFDVSVKGNTALTGAVIAGAEDAAKNNLFTGTLTFADVGNHSHYSANSIGGSVGLSPGTSSDKAVGTASVPGSGGPVPMIGQNESGDQSSATRSAVGAGTVNIADKDRQTQDVASLSRDTMNTNGTVASTPDVNEILNQRADTMQAAQAAGQVVAQGIGAYADVKRNIAQANYDKEGAATWAEGGSNRVALHVIGGGLIGGLGGGSIGTAAAGAAGAGVASRFAPDLNRLADGVGDATGSMTIGNAAANVLAGLGGAIVGGGAGAATAASADLYNRSTGNADGQGSTANSAFGRGKRPGDIVAQACPGTVQCSPAMLNAAIQAQGDLGQQASGAIAPNYATVGASSLSGSVGGAVNLYDGARYVSAGVTQTFPPGSWAPGFTGSLGWIFGARDANSTNAFMNGDGNQAFISIPTPWKVNAFSAVTHAYGGSTAIEIGVTTPSGLTFGVTPWGHSVPIGGSK